MGERPSNGRGPFAVTESECKRAVPPPHQCGSRRSPILGLQASGSDDQRRCAGGFSFAILGLGSVAVAGAPERSRGAGARQSSSPALAGIIGAWRRWTAPMISSVEIPSRPAGGCIDHAERRSRRHRFAVRRPVVQDGPCPRIHSQFATAVPLTVPDEQAASALVEVGLCERERLMDPQTGSPEHDNQPTHPPTVSAVASAAHDRNDLID
jgi:hypothetical protein